MTTGNKLTQEYYAEECLRDGRTVVIRALRASDKLLLQEAMHHLSPRSLYFRFLSHKRELTEKELIYFTEVDFFHHVALLASIKVNGELVPAGVGRYVMTANTPDARQAEVAFAVGDEYQGLGIATLLLRHLTEIARSNGLESFTALVLCDNSKMMDVFHHSGLPLHLRMYSPGLLEVELKL